MDYIDPTESFERLKTITAKTIKEYFPVEGKKQTLVADDVWVDDQLHIDDIHSQKETKEKGRTWGVPVKAKVRLIDNETKKVIDEKEMTVATLPKVTKRFSYIVDGGEWQIANQFRLKSGVYTRIKDNGELESQWNLEKGLGFHTEFDPRTRKMMMRYGAARVPMYPVLKLLGVDDDAIEKSWGKEILTSNKKDDVDASIRQLYKSMAGGKKAGDDIGEARAYVKQQFESTKLRPDSTEVTLGKPFNTVSGQALLVGSKKLLQVSKGVEPPDDRDSLVFKDVYATDDLIAERLQKDFRRDITRKLGSKIDRAESVSAAFNLGTFSEPIRTFFTNSAISERPTQMNPINFLAGARQTTIGGQHGVQDEQKILLSAQSINPSHVGFLDPIQTPESGRIGTILQLGLGTKKQGKDIFTRVYNVKTGKTEYISPTEALKSVVAFPDQYKWEGNKAIPRHAEVKVIDGDGETTVSDPKDVKYIFRSTKGMFDVSANMIPFLQNNQGNRTMVAAKQVEQAVSLKDREAPLVQTQGEDKNTFERAVGRFNSHPAPVAGEVLKVSKTGITIKGEDGKKHDIQLYDDFPLNDNKSLLNSEPLVKVGDKVTAGQTVADTNYTRGGMLALGTNLKVAYTPYKGYNFEDGIVISESAAKKLTSEHMLRHAVATEADVILNKKKFLAETAGQITKEQEDKLDDTAVVKEGTVVGKGDILLGALKKAQHTPEQQQLALFSKKLLRPVKDESIRWDKEYPGIVSKVIRHGKETTVYVRAQTPAEVGDKIVGRHGNKGIITKLIPDHEMPKTADGNHVEVLLNPAGVPTRINLGQVLETAASKIARKTGKPYVVNNFDPDTPDFTRKILGELKEHNLSDTEELFDPKTNKKIGDVLTGEQYILKLHHTAEKGITARSRAAYDTNMQPKKGPGGNAQSMDVSGLYALLAHGARENVREMQTVKADNNDEYWVAIQAGESPPTPRIPFVYKKFEGYLNALGVDTRKDGNRIHLSPLTDQQILKISNGEIKRPAYALRGKDNRPEPGGIFDPEITGTRWPNGNFGEKWSHIKLATRMPNPVFETPIRTLTGLSKKELDDTVAGRHSIDGQTGPSAVIKALEKVDVPGQLKTLETNLPKLRGQKLDKAVRQLRYLRALNKLNMTAKDAYTLQHIPVLPPSMRPVSIMDNGDLSTDDVNDTLRGLGTSNEKLQKFDFNLFPEEEAHDLHAEVYDGMKAMMMTGMSYRGRHRKGIGEIIGGGTGRRAKDAFFQGKVVGKRQDLSMRGVIVPEPSLSLDEVAIPRKAAREIFKPFVIRRLVLNGHKPSEAIRKVRENHQDADTALEREIEERPIWLKRDPVLHMYGTQPFMAKLTTGQAVKIHPLATSGFNADFDGDKMGAFVPISNEAVQEARDRLPSKNLFSPSTGRLMFVPTQESMLGLYSMTRFGKKTTHRFKDASEAARAALEGKIDITDVIKVDNPTTPVYENSLAKQAAEPTETTLGRLLIHHALPESAKSDDIISDENYVLDKGRLTSLLTTVGKKGKAGEFAATADRLKFLGNRASTGFSFGLKDLVSDTEYRDEVLAASRVEERKIRAQHKDDKKTRDEKVIALYEGANEKIQKVAKAKADASNNRMYAWVKSGARGNWDQFRQMTVTPLLVVDSMSKTIPVPITKSYSEGLDVGSYFASMHGARMGAIGRVISTQDPGALTKEMMQTSMNQLVTEDDCSTSRGASMKVEDPNIVDRFTTAKIELGNRGGNEKEAIPAGTLITPDVLNRLKNNKIKDISVRTPLKCQAHQGLCAKCFGLNENGHLHQKGTNLGIMAAHALGEPLTQMAMNSFHTGGVAGSAGAKALDQFTRVEHVIRMPKTLPGSSVLATADGRVEKITQDKATGGVNVTVGGVPHFIPALKGSPVVTVGQEIKKGDSLTNGPKNPHELLPLTSVGSVQRYLVDEISALYGKSPLHRRNSEVFIRALTNLSEVKDPGDHPDFLPGDKVPYNEVASHNAKLEAGKRPVEVTPILKGTNVLPTEVQTDWIAMLQSKNLKSTITDAAAEGWHSNIHGVHPIPGMAFGVEFGKGTKDQPWLY
jgi:DNA-directed RNA polymerase subunit beta'